jgi:hypothetical protein
MNPTQQAYTVATGTSPISSAVISTRTPTTNDINYPIGKFWIDTANETLWYLNSQTNASGTLQSTWIQVSSGASSVINVPQGGTGSTSFTPFTVITAGPTSTSPLQNVAGVGTTGQVLTSNGAGNLPTWQNSTATNAVTSITTSTGTSPVMPSSGSISVLGNGSITTVGSMAVVTVELTGLTQYNVLVGQGTTTIGLIPPSSQQGVPLVSNGGGNYPTFSPALVVGGGTGETSFTPNSLIAGGAIPAGNLQNVGTGTAGQVLTSQGPSALPIWQTSSASGAVTSITTTGGTSPVGPSSGNINVLGAGSITTIGSANTVTVELTGLTQYNVLLGTGTTTIGLAAPSSQAGIPLVSLSGGNYPAFGTASVAGGGTGNTTFTPNGVIVGGAIPAGALQNVGTGTTGQVLTSNGTGLPSWQTSSASGAVTQITTSAGTSPVGPSSGNLNVLGAGSITTIGSTNTVTVELTGLTQYNVLLGQNTTTVGLAAPTATVGVPLVSTGGSSYPAFGTATVGGGGTGDTSFTAYSVITGGTTSTGALQNVSGVGVANQVLTSNGPGMLPSWQTISSSITPINVITYDTAGTYTYTPTSGMKLITVEGCGGGGSGAAVPNTSSSQVAASSGGGSGGYSKYIVTAAQVGTSQPVVVGAGGFVSGGSLDGKMSSFGSGTGGFFNFSGGFAGQEGFSFTPGGVYITTPSGSGNYGSSPAGYTPIVTAAGNVGTSGIIYNANNYQGGVGGASYFGGSAGGGLNRNGIFKGYGSAGYSPGGGGGGNINTPSSSLVSGLAGADGIVIITEYF